MEKGLNASAKGFGPCQPAQSAQTDMDRNILLLVDFQRIKRQVKKHDSVGFLCYWRPLLQAWLPPDLNTIPDKCADYTGRLAQMVERRTREHNVSGLYRCGFESPAGQLKLLIVFRMRR